MATRVELHPAAVTEAAEARAWYADRNEEVGTAFLTELDRAIARIGDDPSSLPMHLTAPDVVRSAGSPISSCSANSAIWFR